MPIKAGAAPGCGASGSGVGAVGAAVAAVDAVVADAICLKSAAFLGEPIIRTSAWPYSSKSAFS